jgi:hypothetical protein
VTVLRDAPGVSPTPPAESSGLVIIRAWAEPGVAGGAAEALRARITLAWPPELVPEETFTLVGLDAGLALVRAFLTEVAEAARSGAD